jgi:uncharacterized protein VirK/YbjX
MTYCDACWVKKLRSAALRHELLQETSCACSEEMQAVKWEQTIQPEEALREERQASLVESRAVIQEATWRQQLWATNHTAVAEGEIKRSK